MFYENIIIGGGPAALQCAYFFDKYNIPYVILERNDKCGSFFDRFPLGNELISINKKYTGKDNADFNLRHDWNSLLNDEQFNFTEYEDKYYPDRENYVKYLNDFAKKNNTKIKFNTVVSKITKSIEQYNIHLKNSNEHYTCKSLIVATGLSLPNIPQLDVDIKDKIKHYCEFPRGFLKNKEELMNEFGGKRVMIIGGGNSSFEMANALNDKNITSSVIISCRKERDWAQSSHYAGDIRSIYLPFMDTFLLKSLNGIANRIEQIKIRQESHNGVYEISSILDVNRQYIEKFDKIVYCTGWKFDKSIFDFDLNMTINGKYPEINSNYESTNNNKMYFIGSLMHSLDYRKSSGGFVHGFRYLIKLFIEKNYIFKHIHTEFAMNSDEDITKLSTHIMSRINTSSNIYQMFGILCDYIIYNKKLKSVIYYENINKNYMINQANKDLIYFHITLDYNVDNKVTKISDLSLKHSSLGSESKAHLLHPIIEVFDSDRIIEIIHLDEEIVANFTDKHMYQDRLIRLFKSYF